ncbi:hypothetical protein BJ165DRAFT_1533287 [Panaeolus papilionaceus]|nr:hypothetical protein BJ165DRAFT_1533287 [Panaeolus papilionaceus]
MSTRTAHRKLELFDPIHIYPLEGSYPEYDEDIFIFITFQYEPESCASLMGPTGAGKSAFIEAIAQDKTLSISKNSLDSVTKEVTPYFMDNRSHLPVILIDTPGLLDMEIIDSTVILKVLQAIQGLKESCNGSTAYVHLLYFERITDNRMSGRKLRCLNLFKFFAEHVDMSCATTVVTTMWNELHTEQQLLRALGRLEAIEDQFWKHLSSDTPSDHLSETSLQTGVSRFMNTRESALSILRSGWCVAPDLSPHVPFQGKRRFDAYLSMTLLSGDIIRERIMTLRQSVSNIDDLTHWIKLPFLHPWRLENSHRERERQLVLIESHRKELSDLAKGCIMILRQQLPVIELEYSRLESAHRESWWAITGTMQTWTERHRIKALVQILSEDLQAPKPLSAPPPTPLQNLRRKISSIASSISQFIDDLDAWWERRS